MKFINKLFFIKFEKGNLLSVAYPIKLTIYILGIKLTFNFNTSFFKKGAYKAFYTNCDIEDLDYVLSKKTQFTHITGIVINKDVRLGENCIIRHNVTIGQGKYSEKTQRCYPVLGNKVDIGTGSIVIGGITIGDNVTIGAGSVVVKDVPSNATVVGNPAKIIKINGKKVTNKS